MSDADRILEAAAKAEVVRTSGRWHVKYEDLGAPLQRSFRNDVRPAVVAVLRELARMDAFPEGFELADEIEGDR